MGNQSFGLSSDEFYCWLVDEKNLVKHCNMITLKLHRLLLQRVSLQHDILMRFHVSVPAQSLDTSDAVLKSTALASMWIRNVNGTRNWGNVAVKAVATQQVQCVDTVAASNSTSPLVKWEAFFPSHTCTTQQCDSGQQLKCTQGHIFSLASWPMLRERFLFYSILVHQLRSNNFTVHAKCCSHDKQWV